MLVNQDSEMIHPKSRKTFGVCCLCLRRSCVSLIWLLEQRLLLQEAGLEYNAAAVDLAVYLLWVVSEADTLNLCASLDDHR